LQFNRIRYHAGEKRKPLIEPDITLDHLGKYRRRLGICNIPCSL
jgi:hypothetical protein